MASPSDNVVPMGHVYSNQSREDAYSDPVGYPHSSPSDVEIAIADLATDEEMSHYYDDERPLSRATSLLSFVEPLNTQRGARGEWAHGDEETSYVGSSFQLQVGYLGGSHLSSSPAGSMREIPDPRQVERYTASIMALGGRGAGKAMTLKEYEDCRKALKVTNNVSECRVQPTSPCAICLEPLSPLVFRKRYSAGIMAKAVDWCRKLMCCGCPPTGEEFCMTLDTAHTCPGLRVVPWSSFPEARHVASPPSVAVSAKHDDLQLPCGHVYHEPCIRIWLTTSKSTCPLCLAEVIPTNGKPLLPEARRIRFHIV